MDDSASNSNPSSSLPPPLRSRSLLDLPTELLGVIVKMCADQDEAFRHRLKLITSYHNHQVSTGETLDQQAESGYGSSLYTISMLCSRTHSLAAPHIFKTLKASSTFPGLAYRFYIVPNHLHHFQHLILDKADHEAKISLVASLNSFTNLRELTLEKESAQDTFGDDIMYSYFRQGPIIRMLRRRGEDIRILHLLDFDLRSAQFLHTINVFPNLRQLSIIGLLQTTKADLQTLVQSLVHLEELTLDNHKTSEATFPSEFSSAPWPRIKKLNLIVTNIQTTTIDFIRNFESSLLELSMTTPRDEDIDPEPAHIPPGALFPLLHTVSILGSSKVAWGIFGNSTRFTFPSLIRVRLSYTDQARHGFADDDEVLHKILDVCTSTIRFLKYDPPDQDSQLEHQTYLRSKADTANFQLQLYDCPERTFPISQVLNDPAECVYSAQREYSRSSDTAKSDLKPLREQVERVRNHLDDSIAVAELTGNPVEYQRILNLARPLEYDRLAKLD